MSTIHSNNKMGTTSVGEIGSSGLPANMGLASHQNSQYAPGMTAGNVGVDGGGSRILSAETIGDKQQKKTITDILQEMITNKSGKDTNNEMSNLRIENDMVTTFFDNVTKLSDHFTFSFVEELKKDVITSFKFLNQFIDRLDHPDSLLECQRVSSFLHLPADAVEEVAAGLRQLREHPDLLQDPRPEDQ